ncbi:MAG: hypothetical protein ACRDP6_14885 [Actinoallomurus sp.]
MLTPEQLAEIEARADRVRSWRAVYAVEPVPQIVDVDVPALLTEVRSLNTQMSTARDIVERAVRHGYDIGGIELDDLAEAFGLNGGDDE